MFKIGAGSTEGRIWRRALICLTFLLVASGELTAEIGFKRQFASEPVFDPMRHSPVIGFTSALWDTTAAPDTTAAGVDTSQVGQDSVPADTLVAQVSAPAKVGQDSVPADTLVGQDSVPTTPLPGVFSPPSPTETGEAPGTADGTAAPSTGKLPPSGAAAGESALTGDATGATGGSKKPSGGPFRKGELPEVEPEFEVSEEPIVHRPTLIREVIPPLDMKAELDTSTGYVMITNTMGGSKLPLEGAIRQDDYIQRRIANADREAWRKSVMGKMPTRDESKGEGIQISIPVFKSERARRIFGGSDIGLSVSGNIKIDGSLKMEKREEISQDQTRPTNYGFKINQTQQFVIAGKVGEKVDVAIDQNSERLFDFENNLKITYTGEQDEIVHRVEAGNVSMSLGGASLVSVSARHQGLFGFKTESQIGALKLTTITSLQKGEKNQISISGGSQQGKWKPIDPTDYVQRRYYFLDHFYREQFRHFTASLEHTDPNRAVIDLEVFISVDPRVEINSNFGWALWNPADTVGISARQTNDGEHQSKYFGRLVPGEDYIANYNLGYIRFRTPVAQNAVVGVAYTTALGRWGDLDPSDNGPDTPPFVLKLIKPQNPAASDSTWNLMWRNVYYLQAENIAREGFEGRIVLSATGGAADKQDADPDGVPYIRHFGLDWAGEAASGPDGQIDFLTFIKPQFGELWFPDPQPFYPLGWFREDVLQANSLVELNDSTLYRATDNELRNHLSNFEIEVKYSSASSTYDLGYNVLKGSVEVFMNGSRLTEGSDYRVDYIAGDLTILRQEALAATADIDIRYETGELFQTDTKTLLGLRAEYELWESSSIGATVAYYNEKKLERRIRVGGEPLRNSIWDIDATIKFKPYFLTKAVDALPLLATDKPSTFTIEGEVAQVFPNPNNMDSPATGDYNGLAYIDDFESVKRTTPLGVTMLLWRHASFPVYDDRGQGTWQRQRGRVIWYNPLDQIERTDIWPELEVQAQNSTIPTMKIEYQPWWSKWDAPPEEPVDRTASWGGIMRYLGGGYADQSQSKYIEIWMNVVGAPQGVMYIDLGQISEDVIPDGILNTEDHPIPGIGTGDGILTSAEDIGLDGKAGEDPSDSTFVNDSRTLLPSWDDWKSFAGRDYTGINGTENNRSFEAGRYPDTEDLDNDGILDLENEFYRYRIDLSLGDDNPYIAGGLGNEKNWRLFRIPLADTLRVGRPAMTALDYARIWFTGCTNKLVVQIAVFDIVGNEWLEEQVEDARGRDYEPLSVATANTHDNPGEYRPPPGVSGERDPITNLEAKEQSLVLRINRLNTGEYGEVSKILPNRQEMNLLDYRQMKMFVHGGGKDSLLMDRFGRELDLELYLRFGTSNTKGNQSYYEYSRRLKPGWSDNEVKVDFDRLTSLKFLRLEEGRDYDILPDGSVIRMVGDPSLGNIKFFTLGIKNHGLEIVEADRMEVWVDELRVTDVLRDPGWAAKGSANLDVAGGFFTLRTDIRQTQADFHSVDRKSTSSGGRSSQDELSGKVSSSIKLDEFFSPRLGLRLPVSFSYDQSVGIPKYLQGSDLKLTTVKGGKVDIWPRFGDIISDNRRFSGSDEYQDEIESQISLAKSYAFSSSISKRASNNRILRMTVDGVSLRGSFQERFASSPTRLYDYNRRINGEGAYTLSLDQPLQLPWLFWATRLPLLRKWSESKLNPLPTTFNLGAKGGEDLNRYSTRPEQRGRAGRITERYQFDVSRDARIGFRPLDILSFDFSQGKAGLRVVDDTLRTYIAESMADLDSAAYFDSTGSFDFAAYDSALVGEVFRLKEALFWKAFGAYFIDDEFTQAVNGSFSPRFVSWLGTELTYSSRYRWSWQIEQLSPGSRSVSAAPSFTSSVTFRLPQLVNAIWSDVDKGPPPAKGLTPGRQSREPHDASDNGMDTPLWMRAEMDRNQIEAGETVDEMDGMDVVDKVDMMSDSLVAQPDSVELPAEPPGRPAPKLTDIFIPAKIILKRLKDIRWNYSRSGDYRNYAVGDGQAGWRYRLGWTQDPGLGTVPGYIQTNSFSNRWEHRFSTGMDITKDLGFSSLQYAFSQSRSVSQEQSGTKSRTVLQYFGPDKVSIKSLPILNWSLRWGGWEKLPLLSDYATSVNLDHSFTGNMTETWRQTANDSIPVATRVEYSKEFNPLLGISFAWKGGIGTQVRYTQTQRVYDERTGNNLKSFDQTRNINLSANYTSRRGFRIPLKFWPFNNKRFSNSTSFGLAYDNQNTVQRSSARGEPFATTNKTSSWSLRPSIEYSFSSTVRGGFHYEYAVTNSPKAGGKVKSQDFGFSINISIHG